MALKTSLISVWEMDDASGNATDSHGSNTLTETSGTIASATGKIGNCRDFEDGDTEYFTIADNASLSTGDIDCTWSCWVNVESQNNQRTILCKDLTGTNREFRFWINSGGTSYGFGWLSMNNGTSAGQLDMMQTITNGQWYFVVFWHDSVNNLIGMSVDDGTPVTVSYSGGMANSTAPFSIGWLDEAPGLHFDGMIDQTAFWKRVLTSAEITELYNSGNGKAYSTWDAAATTNHFLTLLGVGG